jgi:hypothetical protein
MRHSLSQGVSVRRPAHPPALSPAGGTACPRYHAMAASDTEIAELRSMLNQMKSQYESRIAALESRLAKAERDARPANPESPAPSPHGRIRRPPRPSPDP